LSPACLLHLRGTFSSSRERKENPAAGHLSTLSVPKRLNSGLFSFFLSSKELAYVFGLPHFKIDYLLSLVSN
jgi:hypothetical protein